jgi:hypothetical protein
MVAAVVVLDTTVAAQVLEARAVAVAALMVV